jgi:hypothetical protein
MANETEQANWIHVAAFVSANAAPHFAAAAVMPGLITTEDVESGSDAKIFRNRGSLTMAVTNESTDSSVSEYTETSVQLDFVKGTVYIELSDEAEEFQDENRLQILSQEAGRAAARLFDTSALALANGFTTTARATTVDLTIAEIKEALYKLDLNDAVGPRSVVLHPTAAFDAFGAVLTATGTVYGSGLANDVLGGQEKPAGYIGTFLNVPFYQSTLTATANAGADWACLAFTPYAIAAIKRPQLKVKIGYNVKKAVHEMNVIMYHDLGEWKDTAGVLVLADV